MTDLKPTYEELEKRIKELEERTGVLLQSLNEKNLENELKYFGILDTLSEGVVLNEAVFNENNEIINSKIIEVNKAFYRLTGFSEEQTIGNYSTKLYGMEEEYIKAFWKENLEKNEVVYTEMYLPQVDRYLFISTSPIKNSRFVSAFFDITERKKNENELRSSKEILDLIFKISPSIAVITRFSDGLIIKVNERFVSVSEYSREEVLGKTSVELNLYENIESRKKVIDDLEKNGYSENNEIIFRTKSGKLFPGIMSSQVVNIYGDLHIYSNILDITDRKNVENLLNDSVKHFKMLIELAPDAFFQGDTKGKYITINDKAIELTGYSREELLKMNMRDLFTDHEMNKKPLRYDLLNLGETIKNERELKRKNGEKVFVEMSSKAMPDGTYQSLIRDITDRIQAEEKLRESESKFRKIYEEGPLGMALVGKDYKFSTVNNMFSKMMGYSEDELKNMSFKDITHPDFLASDIENISRLVKGEISKFKTEKKYIRKDKREIWGSVTLTSNYVESGKEHYLVVMLEDISERKIIEELLRQSEAKYRSLVETTGTGFVIVDELGKVFDANNEYVRLTGHENIDDIIGRNVAEWTAHYDIERNKDEIIKCYKSGYVRNLEIDYIDKKGNITPVEINATVLKTMFGKSIVTLCRDISMRKNVEQELINAKNQAEKSEENLRLKNEAYEQKNEELLVSKEKAEENDRLKSAFLQNMSHEIRTPMNAICGFSRMLNKTDLSEEKRRTYADIIQNSGQQLLSIVSNILTISALETNQEKINNGKVNINSVIIELKTIFKQQLSDKNIALKCFQFLPDNEAEIYSDKTKLTQILTNLLSNAIKFTSEGTIDFGYQLKGDYLEFFVKDTGIGIPQEMQKIIFERFRQADTSINKKYGGTGLGLSISKGFVELMGGKIWVTSENGSGSSFYFTLPYKKIYEQDLNTVIDEDIENYELSGTVLVAEDEEFNFLYIEQLLSDKNLNIIRAVNGKEAIDLCISNPEISVVLMDIKLPIIDGHDAANRIKELRPDLPVLAQSAYALNQEIERFREVFDDYITKPIEEDELIRKLNKYLK